MTTARDKIAEIIRETVFGPWFSEVSGEYDAAVQILAALPDMIRPLFWMQSKLLKTSESGQYSVEHYYDPDGFGVWAMIFDNHVESDHETEKEAKAAANAHHRAQIMAAFIPSTKGATS
tara:strand:- start:1548 stop:1904 length:357 start_codon:yes stop_codon:yes gene_type:complete